MVIDPNMFASTTKPAVQRANRHGLMSRRSSIGFDLFADERMLALKCMIFTVVLACVVILDVASARAAGGPLRGLDGKCLDVWESNSTDGTRIVLWPCNGGASQQWELRSDGTIHGLAGKCLDVWQSNSSDGTGIVLWPCHSGQNQRWALRPDGTIQGLGGKCLDVWESNSTDGTRIVLWPCHGSANQRWSVSSPDPHLNRPFNVVAIGDSIVWGQGLLNNNKFVSLVVESLKRDLGTQDVVLHMLAHSGAVLFPVPGEDTSNISRFPGEVPTDYPSIYAQITRLAKTKVSPDKVDLVVIDGCINVVGVPNIISPFQSKKGLEESTQSSCAKNMHNILFQVAQTFPRAKVVVIGYFPIISKMSDLDSLMDLWLGLGLIAATVIPPDPLAFRTLLTGYQLRAAALSDLWFKESTAGLQLAVTKINALSPPLGGNRFRYASPVFKHQNSYAGPQSWLWKLPRTGPPDIAQDQVYQSRAQQCRDAHIVNPLCFKASIGHPNVEGARAYANAITAAIAEFLPEWRTAFGINPPSNTDSKIQDPKGKVCHTNEKCCGKLENGRCDGDCITKQEFCN